MTPLAGFLPRTRAAWGAFATAAISRACKAAPTGAFGGGYRVSARVLYFGLTQQPDYRVRKYSRTIPIDPALGGLQRQHSVPNPERSEGTLWFLGCSSSGHVSRKPGKGATGLL